MYLSVRVCVSEPFFFYPFIVSFYLDERFTNRIEFFFLLLLCTRVYDYSIQNERFLFNAGMMCFFSLLFSLSLFMSNDWIFTDVYFDVIEMYVKKRRRTSENAKNGNDDKRKTTAKKQKKYYSGSVIAKMCRPLKMSMKFCHLEKEKKMSNQHSVSVIFNRVYFLSLSQTSMVIFGGLSNAHLTLHRLHIQYTNIFFTIIPLPHFV